MDDGDRDAVRFEYEQAFALVRMLNEVRFKLLAFVPTVAGAAVALLSETASDEELLSVGLIGAVATLGIFAYEMRNTRHYGATVDRLKALDTRLGIRLFDPPEAPALGAIRVRQLLALELVYGAALAAWLYLVFWSALDLFAVPWPRFLGAVIGVAVAAAIVGAAQRAAGPSAP